MYKFASILYLICFTCYILFSRTPDYFEGEFLEGVIIVNNKGAKAVRYSIENVTYEASIESWGASQLAEGQMVPVIYNPSVPKEASVYTFFSYWLKLGEILVTASAFIIMFIASFLITGKEEDYYYSEDEKRKKRKYDD